MKKITQTENGFSLIEALVAMMVLSTGIMSLYLMQLNAIRGNAQASHLTSAVAVGENVIELLMQADFTDSALSAGSTSTTHDSSELTGVPLPSSVTAVSWTVEDWGADTIDNDGDGTTDESDEGNCKKVTLTIVDSNGETTTMQFLKENEL